MLTALKDYKTSSERLGGLEKELGIEFSAVKQHILPDSQSVHCENLIGATQIPLGVAGPLKINGEEAKGTYYIPLATTEGALVASVSRGSKALSLCGGALVTVSSTGQTRGPVFSVTSSTQRKKFLEWISVHENEIRNTAEKTSTHLTYKSSFIRCVGEYIFIRFSYDTDNAMGMNMVTIATEAVSRLISQETGAKLLSVAGNFDIDKKPAWLNFIENRGYCVSAEVILPKETVAHVLKITPQQFFETWLAKCMIGSAMSGSLGFNAHFANVIAGIFLATGQDPAHVVEGSMGITTARVLANEDLYISIYIPALLVGTIGGGTNLPTQREALQMLDCTGASRVAKFAEIIGGAVLAGEISLLASLAEGSLGKAHEKHGRNKGVNK